jgi:WD40 repeat protein
MTLGVGATTAALLAALGGCSDDVETAEPGTATTTTTTTTTTTFSVGGAGGSTTSTAGGGSGGGGYSCPEGGFAPYTPTPEEIDFEAVNPLPSGAQILFNTWAQPDSVYSLSVDGSTATEIFRAYRVWSLGASHAGDKLAFACGDPLQLEHYGIATLDAIQHTWLYDVATESATLLADGTINDECHQFSADDTALYVCRRYDWKCDPEWYTVNKGYRIGRIDLATQDFTFITELGASLLDLHPQPNADETSMLFTRVTIDGGDQSRAIMQKDLPSGTPSALRDNANAPTLSPDGLSYVYTDYDEGGLLYASDLAGTSETLVVEAQVTSVRFSPDGTRVAYLRWDNTDGCSHIETAAVDGSQASAPTRIRDCGETDEFITEIAWIDRP